MCILLAGGASHPADNGESSSCIKPNDLKADGLPAVMGAANTTPNLALQHDGSLEPDQLPNNLPDATMPSGLGLISLSDHASPSQPVIRNQRPQGSDASLKPQQDAHHQPSNHTVINPASINGEAGSPKGPPFTSQREQHPNEPGDPAHATAQDPGMQKRFHWPASHSSHAGMTPMALPGYSDIYSLHCDTGCSGLTPGQLTAIDQAACKIHDWAMVRTPVYRRRASN